MSGDRIPIIPRPQSRPIYRPKRALWVVESTHPYKYSAPWEHRCTCWTRAEAREVRARIRHEERSWFTGKAPRVRIVKFERARRAKEIR